MKHLLTSQSHNDSTITNDQDRTFVSNASKQHSTLYTDSFMQDTSQLAMLADSLPTGRSDECKKPEKVLEDDKAEIEETAKRLNVRVRRLEEFGKELGIVDVDMILFRNKLAREIVDACNDLKEAHSCILILLNNRSIMKDQFCILNMKIRKLKGFNRSFQEDLQA